MRTRNLVLAVLVAAFVPLTGTPAAHADEPPSCSGVMSGAGDGPLTKTYVSHQDNGDGTWTVRYTLQTPRGAGTYRVRDCAFIDLNGNSTQDANEPLFGTDQKDVVVGADGLIPLELIVTSNGNQTVCDRGALSGNDTTGGSFTDKSNVVCTLLDPGTQVPVGAIGGIGLTILAALGLWFATMRSRRRTATT